MIRSRVEDLPMSKEQQRGAAVFWHDQVDAAAVVEADAKIDGGGRARMLVGARKKTMRRGTGGE